MTYHNTPHMTHQPQYWVDITGKGIIGITRQCLDSRWFLMGKEMPRYSQEFQRIIDGLWRNTLVPTRLDWRQQYLALASIYNTGQGAEVLPTRITWRSSIFKMYNISPSRQTLESFLGVRFQEDTTILHPSVQTVNSETRLRATNTMIRTASSLKTDRSREIYYQFEDYWYNNGSTLAQECLPLDNELAIDEETWTVAVNNEYRRKYGSIIVAWGELSHEILELFLNFAYTQKKV